MLKNVFLGAVVAVVVLGLLGSVFALKQHSLVTPAPPSVQGGLNLPIQLDYYVTLERGVGSTTSWQNVPIEPTGTARLSGSATNYSYGGSHVVRVDLTLTNPNPGIANTEMLKSIVVRTCPEIKGPYTTFWVDSVSTALPNGEGQVLNWNQQLDFRVTLDHPYTGSSTDKYSINIKIYGNYE